MPSPTLIRETSGQDVVISADVIPLTATFTPGQVMSGDTVLNADGIPMTVTPTLVPAQAQAGDVIVVPATVPADVVPGQTTFTIAPAQAQPVLTVQPITVGTTLTGTLTTTEPGAVYGFTATREGPIYVFVQSGDIGLLTLGHAVMREGGGGGGGGGGGPMLISQASINFYVYPDDQVQIFISSASGGETGSFTLSVQQAEPQQITYGDSVEATISGQVPLGFYTFEGQQDDVITLSATGVDGFDTQLALTSSDPSFYVTDDDGGPGYDSEIYRVRLPASGTYRVTVNPMAQAGGTYTLSLSRETPLSLDTGPQTIAFNNKDPQWLTFEGHTGETVNLNVRTVADSTVPRTVTVSVVQNGHLLTNFSRDFGNPASLESMGSGVSLVSSAVVVPDDGPVTVQVSPNPDLSGSQGLKLEVQLERPE
jgi:hypothetical protein